MSVARTMRYLAMNKQTAFLGDTIELAMNDLIYYLILLGTIIFGFFSMTHIAFGKTLEGFSTYGLSAMHVIQMFFGTFDYKEMASTDKILAPIFFIFYMFLVLFIFLNIFISILTRAYEEVKANNEDNIETSISCWRAIVAFIVSKIKNIK